MQFHELDILFDYLGLDVSLVALATSSTVLHFALFDRVQRCHDAHHVNLHLERLNVLASFSDDFWRVVWLAPLSVHQAFDIPWDFMDRAEDGADSD